MNNPNKYSTTAQPYDQELQYWLFSLINNQELLSCQIVQQHVQDNTHLHPIMSAIMMMDDDDDDNDDDDDDDGDRDDDDVRTEQFVGLG